MKEIETELSEGQGRCLRHTMSLRIIGMNLPQQVSMTNWQELLLSS